MIPPLIISLSQANRISAVTNMLHHWTVDGKHVLIAEKAWLNDKIMDAAEKLIYMALGNLDSCQYLLNSQKRGNSFYPSEVQVCDSQRYKEDV